MPAYGNCTQRTPVPLPCSSASSASGAAFSAQISTSASETSTISPPPARIASAIHVRTPSGASATGTVIDRSSHHGLHDPVEEAGERILLGVAQQTEPVQPFPHVR